MPYDPTDLSGGNPTCLTWAVAWARLLLDDRTTPETWANNELQAFLASTAFTVDSTVYYRPHAAAGALIESDPHRPVSESLLGASVTHRDPSSIARLIRRNGAWIDDLIEQQAGTRPPGRHTLEVTW